jgi:HK97 family phage portal protein
MLRWVLMWGNAYCEIVRDTSFRPVAIWPVEPWRVQPIRSGGLYYRVQQPTGTSVDIPAADMLHFRGLGDDLAGYSVIGYMARTLGLSIAQENSMAGQMEHGSRPSGLLVPEGGGTIPDKKAETLEEMWRRQNAGSRNHGKVILLNQGLDFKPMQINNTDAQLLESRQFSVLDVCRFLRVPPHKVYELSRATFSNITHQSLEFLVDTLGPWIVKLEQQANRKLISSQWADRYFTKIDSKAILRMDPETRVKWYQGLRDLGAVSPNEIRDEEDMDELGSRGDLYLVPVNMQSLDNAGKEPEPEPPAEPPEPPADETDEEGESDAETDENDSEGESDGRD